MRILVTPMDWGLGHAGRCVPLIRELTRQGAEVILASSGPALDLLRKYFPQLPAERLPAYDIRYPSDNMIWNIARQLPRIGRTVWAEHQTVRRLIRKYRIDCIISDNRFGCFSSLTQNIFITHQLSIRSPMLWGAVPTQGFIRYFNDFFIQRFDECWIPDVPGPDNLTGALSQTHLEIPVRYTGWLSVHRALDLPRRHRCTAVLSGPEPQRSRLETILRPQLAALGEPCLLVQGRIGEKNDPERHGQLTIIPYLLGEELNAAMAAADLVVARSGYSTLMDLAVMRQKALLIPTPGQTEQIYLAERLAERERGVYQTQGKIDLKSAISRLQKIGPVDGVHTPSLLTERVAALLLG